MESVVESESEMSLLFNFHILSFSILELCVYTSTHMCNLWYYEINNLLIILIHHSQKFYMAAKIINNKVLQCRIYTDHSQNELTPDFCL